MALKQSQLQQIPLRNKDLTFGYVNECEKKNKQTIPSMIKYLCLVFFNQNKDGFDIKHTHSEIKIDGNHVRMIDEEDIPPETEAKMMNSYLENIVSDGIHIWKFKCKKSGYYDKIGIRNIESESLPLEDKFYVAISGHSFQAYEFAGDYFSDADDKIIEQPENNDIVEMKLDFNELSLKLFIEGVHFDECDIKHGHYRAAIGFYPYLASWAHEIKLISYQHIV